MQSLLTSACLVGFAALAVAAFPGSGHGQPRRTPFPKTTRFERIVDSPRVGQDTRSTESSISAD